MRPSALFGFRGASTTGQVFLQKSFSMPRILIRQDGALRRLASISATHDGSIKLSLVRNGVSDAGWVWKSLPDTVGDLETRAGVEPRTKSITIHTSGRVNYHYGRGHTLFIPCLMDLEEAFLIVTYVIPDVNRLDAYDAPVAQDYVVDVPSGLSGPLSFQFSVLPLLFAELPNEIFRLGVEGLYGLSCVASRGSAKPLREGVPDEVFTCLRPDKFLPGQAVREEVAFLRFKQAMYANDVHVAVESELDEAKRPSTEAIEALIAEGPGLFPPNSEGVWTFIASVPMRLAPRLHVDFADPRYRAEVVEIRPGDTRLATVRVRFKVFDEKTTAYVKTSVTITNITLDAEI